MDTAETLPMDLGEPVVGLGPDKGENVPELGEGAREVNVEISEGVVSFPDQGDKGNTDLKPQPDPAPLNDKTEAEPIDIDQAKHEEKHQPAPAKLDAASEPDLLAEPTPEVPNPVEESRDQALSEEALGSEPIDVADDSEAVAKSDPTKSPVQGHEGEGGKTIPPVDSKDIVEKSEKPKGWGKVAYLTPEQQRSCVPKPKAKAKGKGKAKAKSQPASSSKKPAQGKKRKEVEEPKEESKKDTKRSRGTAVEKTGKRKTAADAAAVDDADSTKARKVDLSEKEKLRSKRCCAYSKVLNAERKKGTDEETAKKLARQAPSLHVISVGLWGFKILCMRVSLWQLRHTKISRSECASSMVHLLKCWWTLRYIDLGCGGQQLLAHMLPSFCDEPATIWRGHKTIFLRKDLCAICWDCFQVCWKQLHIYYILISVQIRKA